MASVTTVCCCILLLCGVSESCDQCALYIRVSSDCPRELPEPVPEPVTSESECALHCTLRQQCRLSVHLRASATCYIVDAVTATGVCSSDMVVRRKVDAVPATSSASGVSTLSFASQVLIWYDFRKGYSNLANPLLYTAVPVNVAELDAINGIRLQGSSSSYVSVSTPGFSSNFLVGKKFSFFIHGKFATDSKDKCMSSFSDCALSTSVSIFNTRNNGGIHSKTYFVDGSNWFGDVNSQTVIPMDTIQRINSIGVSFDGSKYVNQWYFNGTMHATENPSNNGGAFAAPSSYDCLRIGDCFQSSPAPFDGWLQCWGFVNNSLSLSQFDGLRSLCNT